MESPIQISKAPRSRSPDNKASTLAVVLAVCAWFIFAFRNYLPDLNSAALHDSRMILDDVLRRWGFFDVPLVLFVLLAAYLTGKRLLEVLKLTEATIEAGMERLWLRSATGLAALSLTCFALASVHLFYRASIILLLSLPVAFSYREIRELGRRLRPYSGTIEFPSFSAGSLIRIFLVGYIAVVLAVVYLSAIGPELEFDPLAMHLVAARAFVQQHRLTAVREVPQAFFPKNITLLFSLGMMLRSEITAKLINYLFGLLSIAGAFALAKRLHSNYAGLVAAAILASSPLFIWEMRTAHVDGGFALYVFLSLYATIRWLDNDQRQWFRLAVLATAFSLGTKYQALFSLGALTVVILIYRLTERRGFGTAVKQALMFFLFSALGLIPWAIVNYRQTGNPAFPFLNGLFHSQYWNPQQTQTAMTQMVESGVPITLSTWWAVVTNSWTMVMDQTDRFHGNIGIFYLLLIPLLLFQWKKDWPAKRTLYIILGFSLSYWLLWLFTGQHARYYLGALPGLAVVAACSLVYWMETMAARAWRPVAPLAAVILAVIAVFNSPFFENYGASSRYGSAVAETIPWKMLVGEERAGEFLSRRLADYDAVQFLNRIPSRKKVLFWWNTDPIGFYLNGEFACVFSYYFDRLRGGDSAEMYRVLREHSVTHVIVGQQYQENDFLSNPEKDFVQHYLLKIYQRNAIVVYKVVGPDPERDANKERVTYDFLGHIGEASMKMLPNPEFPASDIASYRVITETGSESERDKRQALLMFPPAEVEFQVTLPERPAIRFAIGRKFKPCVNRGTFEVWITEEGGQREQVFREETAAANETRAFDWMDREIDLAKFAGRQVTISFQADVSDPHTCNWYLWADPQIVSRPQRLTGPAAADRDGAAPLIAEPAARPQTN